MASIEIQNEFIVLESDARKFDDVITEIGSVFLKHDVVKDSYIDAVISREKKFPTGLETGVFNISMPHTDPEHVNKTAISFVRTKSPIEVFVMGSLDKKIETSMFFVLSLLDPHQHMQLLMKLMQLFQNEEKLDILNKSNDKQEIFDLLTVLTEEEEK